jgi:hypothetical protein
MSTTVQSRFIAAGLILYALLASAPLVAASDFSQAEIDDLVFLREEEKLARDVYDALRLLWGSRVFANIESSEQIHMDAIKAPSDRCSIPDPADGRGYGDFANPELQELYGALVARGSRSPVEACRVGILIEEADIRDLQDAIARSGHVDIRTVYGNLLRGSQNHLKAFSSHLGAEGILIE